jgi:hypothetical protein
VELGGGGGALELVAVGDGLGGGADVDDVHGSGTGDHDGRGLGACCVLGWEEGDGLFASVKGPGAVCGWGFCCCFFF